MDRNRVGQYYLAIGGIIAIAGGAAYLFFPVPVAALTGLELSSASAVIDVRATYGGQLIGLGVFALAVSRRPELVVFGLLFVIAGLGGTGLGRLAGAIIEGALPAVMVPLLLFELGLPALGLALAIRSGVNRESSAA